jgi:hypothetical protein
MVTATKCCAFGGLQRAAAHVPVVEQTSHRLNGRGSYMASVASLISYVWGFC